MVAAMANLDKDGFHLDDVSVDGKDGRVVIKAGGAEIRTTAGQANEFGIAVLGKAQRLMWPSKGTRDD